jgi:hypothetical protein
MEFMMIITMAPIITPNLQARLRDFIGSCGLKLEFRSKA